MIRKNKIYWNTSETSIAVRLLMALKRADIIIEIHSPTLILEKKQFGKSGDVPGFTEEQIEWIADHPLEKNSYYVIRTGR